MTAASALLAFLAMFATDYCWARYVTAAKDFDPVRAGGWAVALFLLGAVAVIGYTSNPLLLLPAAVGAFAGTVAGVLMSRPR